VECHAEADQLEGAPVTDEINAPKKFRPNKTQYGMLLVRAAASRATCRKSYIPDGVGCVITSRDGRVLATGYNGSVPGAPHCEDVGHLKMDGHCIRTVHAEANAVADAARRGIALEGGIAYMTMKPCHNCLKLLSAVGIYKVVFAAYYKGSHYEDEHPSYLWLMRHSRLEFEHMPWEVVDHRGGIRRHPPTKDRYESVWKIGPHPDRYIAGAK